MNKKKALKMSRIAERRNKRNDSKELFKAIVFKRTCCYNNRLSKCIRYYLVQCQWWKCHALWRNALNHNIEWVIVPSKMNLSEKVGFRWNTRETWMFKNLIINWPFNNFFLVFGSSIQLSQQITRYVWVSLLLLISRWR